MIQEVEQNVLLLALFFFDPLLRDLYPYLRAIDRMDEMTPFPSAIVSVWLGLDMLDFLLGYYESNSKPSKAPNPDQRYERCLWV